jgi:hypothetical protein
MTSLLRIAGVLVLTGFFGAALPNRSSADPTEPGIRLESTAVTLAKVGAEDQLFEFVLSPDARRFACIKYPGDGLAKLRGLTNKPVLIVDGKENPGFLEFLENGLVFSPDSKRLAFVASSRNFERNSLGILQRPVVVSVWIDQARQPADFVSVGRPVFSPDGKRIIYTVSEGEDFRCLVDGQLGPSYTRFFNMQGNDVAVFSRDSRRYCCVAEKGGKQVLIVDGREYGPYDGLGSRPEFSPDGKNFACIVNSGDRQRFFENGKEGPAYSECKLAGPAFSPDGLRTVYCMLRDGKYRLVDDGQEGEPYDRIESWCFGLDGQLAFLAKRGEKFFVVIEGTQHGPYDNAGGAMQRPSGIFNRDGKRAAYAFQKDKTWTVVIGDQEQKKFDQVWPATVVFSPDDKHCSFIARRKADQFLIVDGREYGPYRQFKGVERKTESLWDLFASAGNPNPVEFSPTGERFGHVATRPDGSLGWLVDGKAGGAYEEMREIVFSPAGKHWAALAFKKGKYCFVVDGVEHGSHDLLLIGTRLVFDGEDSFYALVKDGEEVKRITVQILPGNP